MTKGNIEGGIDSLIQLQWVKTQLAFLELLVTSERKQARALISTMTKSQLNAICEVLINI